MACLRWKSLGGYADVRLGAAGRCHILHEDAAAVSSDDLLGLPSSWLVKGKAYCCAELPCGHTFHVSALALSFLTGEMRCPLCRRGDGFVMTPDNIPEVYRADFLRRMMDMQDSSVYNYGSGTESAADSAAETKTKYSDREVEDSLIDTTQWVRYYDYLMCERQLRLVVELQNSDCEVFVLESPVHFAGLPRQDSELVLDMEQPRRMCVYMRNFYTQRSFCCYCTAKSGVWAR